MAGRHPVQVGRSPSFVVKLYSQQNSKDHERRTAVRRLKCPTYNKLTCFPQYRMLYAHTAG